MRHARIVDPTLCVVLVQLISAYNIYPPRFHARKSRPTKTTKNETDSKIVQYLNQAKHKRFAHLINDTKVTSTDKQTQCKVHVFGLLCFIARLLQPRETVLRLLAKLS